MRYKEIAMTKIYKSARGKGVDIDKLKLSNEGTVAVGNMRTNARGDLLGSGKNVAVTRNQLMDQVYAVPDAGGYSPNDPSTFSQQQTIAEASNARQLSDLVNNLNVPAQPTADATPVQPAARGNLANSVAKQTQVTQEPLTDPRKPTGPTRI
jgi:hypothetical protein